MVGLSAIAFSSMRLCDPRWKSKLFDDSSSHTANCLTRHPAQFADVLQRVQSLMPWHSQDVDRNHYASLSSPTVSRMKAWRGRQQDKRCKRSGSTLDGCAFKLIVPALRLRLAQAALYLV
jgi:hypothetical protein